MKKNSLLLYLLLSFIYLELAFKLVNANQFFSLYTIATLVVALCFISLLYLIINLLNNKGKYIVSLILLFIFGIYFSLHTCLYKFYKFYFEFSTLAFADQTAAFASDGLKVIWNNILYIIIYFIPFILLIVLRKHIDLDRINFKIVFISLLVGFVFYLPMMLLPNGLIKEVYLTNNMIQIVNKDGVLSGLGYDVYNSIFGINNTIDVEEEQAPEEEMQEEIVEEKKYSNVVFDIDFNELNSQNPSSDIEDLNNYFYNKKPSKQNEYTSFFADKNLILFMAESFNGICIDPNLTPTLYKLVHSGFEFNNFYTPTIYSTIGGEFCELTGLYQDINALSIFRSNRNTYPMGIGNLFKEKGYKTYAYHNSSYSFQNRDLYLNNLGFDYYNASGLGLEELMNCRNWPASDVEMINATFDDYINDSKFLVFYATVSGHGPYVFSSSDNQIATKYEDMLREYYGDRLGTGSAASSLMAYEAGQIELDRALETLINKLSSANKLDDTVIALVGDHHPYYLTDRIDMDDYNKLSTYERDGSIELYHSNFILYNNAMDVVRVDKVGGQLDVIPTIYNLFGLNYDSRLLMGTDLLSEDQGVVIMADGSWVNDIGKYYSYNGEFVGKDGSEVSDSYIKGINRKVKNIKNISLMMMENNYYQYIYDNK